jgi:hypothetical protein
MAPDAKTPDAAKQNDTQQQQQQSLVEPKLSEIRIPGRFIGTPESVLQKIAAINLFMSKSYPDSVVIAKIESRDIQKRPFLFMIFTLGPNELSIEYSIAPDTSEKMRRLSIMETLLSILSLISGSYEIDQKDLFQKMETAIEDVLSSISQNYSVLFNKYDALFTEYRDLKRLNIELTAANRDLNVKAFQLTKENSELKDRIIALEVYTDEELMVMVQEWLDSHNSTIDIGEFASNYKLQMPRVEQILNKMQSLGYIELKG